MDCISANDDQTPALRIAVVVPYQGTGGYYHGREQKGAGKQPGPLLQQGFLAKRFLDKMPRKNRQRETGQQQTELLTEAQFNDVYITRVYQHRPVP